jgi:hypothetical protein
MQHATAPQMDSGTTLRADASVNQQTAGLVTLVVLLTVTLTGTKTNVPASLRTVGLVTLVVLLMVTLTGAKTDVPASLRTTGQEKLVVHTGATTIGMPIDASVTMATPGMATHACQVHNHFPLRQLLRGRKIPVRIFLNHYYFKLILSKVSDLKERSV